MLARSFMNHAEHYVLSVRRWRLLGIFLWIVVPAFILIWAIATLFSVPALSSPFGFRPWFGWITLLFFYCYVMRYFMTYHSTDYIAVIKINPWICVTSSLFSRQMLALIMSSFVLNAVFYWLTFVVLFASLSSDLECGWIQANTLWITCMVFSGSATWRFVRGEHYLLAFPAFPLSRWTRVRQRIPLACHSALSLSLFVYVFATLTSLAWIWCVMRDQPTVCEAPLAYLIRIRGFGIALYVTTLLCAFIIHYARHVCEVVDTEPVFFDAVAKSSTLRSDSSQFPLLLLALTHPNPFIKYPAYYDLVNLTRSGAAYRQAFYDARVWPVVLYECCACLDRLCTTISEAINSSRSNASTPAHKMTIADSVPSAPLSSSTTTYHRRATNIQNFLKILYERVKTQLGRSVTTWTRRAHPPVALRYTLFADYALCTWACRALSQLLCASSHEDSLGVVSINQSLPRVLTVFATCLQRLHEYNRCLAEEHPVAGDLTLHGNLFTFFPARALTVSVSTAITRLIVTFYSSLDLYQFPAHTLSTLQEFVHFARA